MVGHHAAWVSLLALAFSSPVARSHTDKGTPALSAARRKSRFSLTVAITLIVSGRFLFGVTIVASVSSTIYCGTTVEHKWPSSNRPPQRQNTGTNTWSMCQKARRETMGDMVKYQLHPACAAWPPMLDHEIEALAADIKVNGLHEPITLTPDDKLLDGRNRAEACERAGVTAPTTVYAGDPWLFSLSKNKHRRHMTVDQIALVAAALVTTKHGTNRFVETSTEVSINDAAAAAGVSPTAINSARTVLRDGTPEEVEAVKTGKAKLRATADMVRTRKRTAKAAAPKPATADAVRSAPVPPKATPTQPTGAPFEIETSFSAMRLARPISPARRRSRRRFRSMRLAPPRASPPW